MRVTFWRKDGTLNWDAVESKILPPDDNGCCYWSGAKTGHGYGMIRNRGSRRVGLVHRLVYQAYKGAIPEGKEIDHICGNKGCVAINHLEAVTHRENIARAMSGPDYLGGYDAYLFHQTQADFKKVVDAVASHVHIN